MHTRVRTTPPFPRSYLLCPPGHRTWRDCTPLWTQRADTKDTCPPSAYKETLTVGILKRKSGKALMPQAHSGYSLLAAPARG